MPNLAIQASVGMYNDGNTNCYNLPGDVAKIIQLLNAIDPSAGGTATSPLSSNAAPRDLYNAILNFQQTQNNTGGFPRLSVDGHVDPGGLTLARLNLVATPAPETAKIDVAMGSISWINPRPNPIRRTQECIELNPNWLPKAALGFIAVSNSAPPSTLLDLPDYFSKKDLRNMTFCALHFEIDPTTDDITPSAKDSFAKAGFTPAFRIDKLKANGVEFDGPPTEEAAILRAIPAVMKGAPLPGETSPLSGVVVGARHPNTAISNVSSNEIVLVNALSKVRANPDEDAVGVGPDPGVPFHVPWVWCELLVTYAGMRKFNIYGRGSTFPSHAWYFNGTRVGSMLQSCDTRFPMLPGGQMINESAMILASFFRKGVKVPGAQTALATEAGLRGSVEQHPNTAVGGALITSSVTLGLDWTWR
jgi:hypothetical protein